MYQLFFSLLFLSLSLNLFAKEVEEMSLEEKVGQMFIAYFEGDEFNQNAKTLIDEVKIGGIIYYNWANDLSDPLKVKVMSEQIQNYAEKNNLPKIFIAVDQEGGRVARLQQGFTEFPGNAALGISHDEQLTYEAAKAMGLELKKVGVNLNLAPVVDVNCNPNNPVIGIRSFGDDPEIVAKLAEATVKGYQDTGLVPCIKHFPGHGDTTVDSHLGIPVVRKSRDEIEAVELYPYKKLVQSVPVMMTAHIRFEALDPDNVATFSPYIIQELLRNEIGYEGLLISDSLTMGGVSENSASLYQAAVKAIDAGNDMIIIGGRRLNSRENNESNIDEVVRLHHGILNAVRNGRISESRIDESVRRILTTKNQIRDSDTEYHVKEHATLAKEVAYRSVIVKKGVMPLNLSEKNVLIIAPKILTEKITETDLMSLGKSTMLYPFFELVPSDDEVANIISIAKNADHIVFCSYNAWKNQEQTDLLKSIAKDKSTTLIATSDPVDLSLSELPENTIATYSPTRPSLQVVAEWMKGKPHPFDLSYEQAVEIGDKVWYNESKKRIDLLTFWNTSEPFPSVGIGHFIWPPKEYNGIFSEGRFHDVVMYLNERGVEMSDWILEAKYPPWSNRKSFYDEFNETKMAQLRSFLVKTVPDQALYMVNRLNQAFLPILIQTPEEKREHVLNQFFRLSRAPNGLYVLVDYLNFKHEGTDPKERYEGHGWGLMQVLQNMQGEKSGLSPEQDFAESAKRVLINRIVNSPNRELEQKWMEGWLNRLKTYTQIN